MENNYINDDYTIPVSFNEDDYEKEYARREFNNDNSIFLNSVYALLRNKETPFLKEENRQLFLDYINSDRPEIQDKVETLKQIREYRDEWFDNNEVEGRYNRINELYTFIEENSILLSRTPVLLNKQIDLNYAVVMALNEEDFHFSDKNNPVRKAWEKLSKDSQALLQSQDLYSK